MTNSRFWSLRHVNSSYKSSFWHLVLNTTATLGNSKPIDSIWYWRRGFKYIFLYSLDWSHQAFRLTVCLTLQCILTVRVHIQNVLHRVPNHYYFLFFIFLYRKGKSKQNNYEKWVFIYSCIKLNVPFPSYRVLTSFLNFISYSCLTLKVPYFLFI